MELRIYTDRARLERIAALVFVCAGLSAQPGPAPVRVEPGLVLHVEGVCSETKLMTSNALLRWSMPKAAIDTYGLAGFAAARQNLEVTVYKNGFATGLLMTFPLGQTAQGRQPPRLAQAVRPQLRAFQINLINVGQPKVEAAASELEATVESLEPGVNYTWRVAIDTPGARIVSAPVTMEAVTCVADIVEDDDVPRRRNTAPKGKR